MQTCYVLTATCLIFYFGSATMQAQETGAKVSNASTVIGRNNHASLVVRVTLNSHGRVSSAVIVKSSGSAILDHHCLAFAKQHWAGLPNTTKDVPCFYKLSGKPDKTLKATAEGSG